MENDPFGVDVPLNMVMFPVRKLFVDAIWELARYWMASLLWGLGEPASVCGKESISIAEVYPTNLYRAYLAYFIYG